MSDDATPLAELVLPSRFRHLCAREGWRTLGDLRDAVADGWSSVYRMSARSRPHSPR